MIRAFAVGITLLSITAGCTGGDPSASESHRPLPPEVTVEGRSYTVACAPVAQALVDVELPHTAGQPMTRAITGIWDHQAIAVLANDRNGCGVWALAMAPDLSEQARTAIEQEVADGVARFGVTESPVPTQEAGG